MTARTAWVTWAAVAVAGHLGGSVALVLAGGASLGASPTPAELLAAPVGVLPGLVLVTARTAGQGTQLSTLAAAWVVYLVPFAAAATVAPLVACWRRRGARARGFAPVMPSGGNGPA